jgi:hypothetical protein
MLTFKFEPDRIMLQVRQIGNPINHPENKEHSRAGAERDAWVAFLLAQGCPANRGRLRHDRNRYAPPPSSISNVVPQLPDNSCRRYGQSQ